MVQKVMDLNLKQIIHGLGLKNSVNPEDKGYLIHIRKKKRLMDCCA